MKTYIFAPYDCVINAENHIRAPNPAVAISTFHKLTIDKGRYTLYELINDFKNYIADLNFTDLSVEVVIL